MSSKNKLVKPKPPIKNIPKSKVEKEKEELDNFEDPKIDIYDYIKNVKKELTKSLKEVKEGIIYEPYINAIQERKDTVNSIKSDNKNSLLDDPLFKKKIPPNRRNFEEEFRYFNHDNDKKKTQISQITEQSRYENKNTFGKMSRLESRASRGEGREVEVKLISKHISKSQSKNESYYELEKQRKIKKDLMLEYLRTKKREEELKLLKDRPTMTETSKQILKTKTNDERPLYLRTSEIIDQKNQFIKNMQRFYLEKESYEITKNNTVMNTKNNNLLITKNTNFLPTNQPLQNYNISSIAEANYNPKKFEDWRNFAIKWDKMRIEKNKKMKEDKENEEFIDDISQPFKPLINSNSEFLASMINNEIPIFERLNNNSFYYKKRKSLEKVYRETTPNFTPNLKKRVPSYLKNVESRLMSVSSAPNLSLVKEKKKTQGKVIHKSKSLNNSLNISHSSIASKKMLNNSQSSLTSRKVINKANSVQSLKISQIKKTQSWVSQLDSINFENGNDDFKFDLPGSLYQIHNQNDIANNVYYNDKHSSFLFNFLPNKRSLKSIHSNASSRVNINFSSEEIKNFNENFDESKIFSNSDLKNIDLSMKK